MIQQADIQNQQSVSTLTATSQEVAVGGMITDGDEGVGSAAIAIQPGPDGGGGGVVGPNPWFRNIEKQ
jgi:hypothetical protein